MQNPFSSSDKLLKTLTTPWKLKVFFLTRLPSLLFWGVRLERIDREKASVILPNIKRAYNPFKSIYFAAQAGAAEFSTGVLAALAVADHGKVSMLVTSMRGEFYIKTNSAITFKCEMGKEIQQSIEDAIKTDTPTQCTATSEGFNADGELVSKFWIEWSFKAK